MATNSAAEHLHFLKGLLALPIHWKQDVRNLWVNLTEKRGETSSLHQYSLAVRRPVALEQEEQM